jgi:carboxylesterase type B
VVIVTFNYRLGALGFLAGGSGINALAGNYGFEDQQLALRWVSRNIRSFGGDPDKVTLFGESAGAISIGAHLVAPASQGLFRYAIMESNAYGIPFKTRGDADVIRYAFDHSPAARQCRGSLPCLAKLPSATIVMAQNQVSPGQELLLFAGRLAALVAWAPYIDERLIFSQPNRAVITRPVIAGTTRDEGTLFVYWPGALPSPLSRSDYESLVNYLFGPQDANEILKQSRYKSNSVDNRAPLASIVSDYFFSCATRHVLARAAAPHFGFAFDHPPSYPVWPQAPRECQPGPRPQGQVCHTFELPFVFRDPTTISFPPIEHHFTTAERRLADAISAYWTDFAVDGDPNSGAAALPQWPAYGAKGIRQVLNLTISRTKDEALDCPLWDRIGYGPGAASLY